MDDVILVVVGAGLRGARAVGGTTLCVCGGQRRGKCGRHSSLELLPRLDRPHFDPKAVALYYITSFH